MRTCLGFMFLNERTWLKKHLPYMLRYMWYGVVAIDGGSTDGSAEVVKEICDNYDVPVHISKRAWKWDFADQQNAVIELAESIGYEAMLKWDPDELMYPLDIRYAFSLLSGNGCKAIKVNRYNFEGDERHYAPYLYPDMQLRFFRLGEGLRWRGRLHATTNAHDLWQECDKSNPDAVRQIVWLPHVHIYHYEGLKPIEERALKWLNYERVAQNLSPLTALPPDYDVPSLPVRFTIEFTGATPT